MELNINSLPDFVKNAEIMWKMGAESVPRYARSSGLFKEISIPQMTGNTREFSEIDLEEYASNKGESEQAKRAKVQQGYTKVGKLKRVAEDIGVSYEWRTQGKYPEIKARVVNLGQMAENRIDLDLSHRIAYGFQSSYVDKDGETVDLTTGDGRPLFDNAHTLRGSALTYRNTLSGNASFSTSALEAMEQVRIENTFNQFGQKKSMPANIIWTTDDQATINAVKVALFSRGNTLDNKSSAVINPYETKYTHVVLPRITVGVNGETVTTKSKYWGLASSEYSTAYLGMHEQPRMITPSAGSNAEVMSTDDWNFGTRAGYMIVIVSASWITASKGDGTA